MISRLPDDEEEIPLCCTTDPLKNESGVKLAITQKYRDPGTLKFAFYVCFWFSIARSDRDDIPAFDTSELVSGFG